MGEGARPYRRRHTDTGCRRLAAHGLTPITFAEKEGLALINGTDGMLGQLVLALADLDRCWCSPMWPPR